MPVGSACASRPKDSKKPAEPPASRYWRAAKASKPGSEASRLAYSPRAGRNNRAGFERIVGGVALDEHPVHRFGRQSVRQPRSDKGARTHADIDAATRQIETLQRFPQRHERPDLIDRAQRSAPRQSDASNWMGRHLRPLSGSRSSHSTTRPSRARPILALLRDPRLRASHVLG